MISSHPDVLAADAAGSMALGNQLARAARLYPDRVALQFDDVRRTYPELHRRVNRLARALAEAMDDWMADISHSDHPRALWKAHVWPASTGLGIYYENDDRGLS